MVDRVRILLEAGPSASADPEVKELDRALFPDPGNRSRMASVYERLLRHPELYPYLTYHDSRLSPLEPVPGNPDPVPLLQQNLIRDLERALLAPGKVFGYADFGDDLHRLWSDAEEGLLRIGAAVLALAEAIARERGSYG